MSWVRSAESGEQDETQLCFVLFNGREFWVSPGTTSDRIGDALRIPEDVALDWVASVTEVDREGFYPVAICNAERNQARMVGWLLGAYGMDVDSKYLDMAADWCAVEWCAEGRVL